jgi:hypothetical protein
VTQEAAARRDSLTFIETMLSEIDAKGNVGGTAADTGSKGLFVTVNDVVTHCQLASACLVTGEECAPC